MKYIVYIILSMVVVGSFTSCSEDNAHFKDAETIINIDTNCSTNVPLTTADIATYVTMLSGDVLVKNENNTSVATYHDQNGTKKVCRISGSAYLIRQ